MKNKKRNIVISIVAVCLFAMITTACSVFLIRQMNLKKTGNILGVSWYNETDKEFTITTKEQLHELSRLSNYYSFEGQTICLGADIVLNEGVATDWAEQEPNVKWSPITKFAGTFDGKGHKISGLYAKGYNAALALFTNTHRKCVVKDVSLVNSYFETRGGKGVASFVSNGGGTFSGLYSDAIFKHNGKRCAGIASTITEQSVFNECWFDGVIYIEQPIAGGIIDEVNAARAEIKHSLFTGEIHQKYEHYDNMRTGGMCGRVMHGKGLVITDCLSAGTITSFVDVQTGSIIGVTESTSNTLHQNVFAAKQTYHKKIAAQKGTNEGGIISYDMDQLTGVKAYQWTSLDFDNYWTVVENDIPIPRKFANEIPSLEGVKKAYDISWYDESLSTYTLKTKEQLYGFWFLSNNTNFKDKFVKLGADIVVNDGDAKTYAKTAPENIWQPIGSDALPFAGIFDGQGHTISGIYLKNTHFFDANVYNGLFAMTAVKSVLKNFRLENSYFERTGCTYAFMGSITGESRGTIESVYSNAILKTSGIMTGGIVGRTNNTDAKGGTSVEIKNCWFDGEIKGIDRAREIGGITAIVMKTASVPNGANINITNCLNTGRISCERKDIAEGEEAQFIGGIVGRDNYSAISLNITSCLNAGKIIVPKENEIAVGSILGSVHSPKCVATVINTYATKESYVDSTGVAVAVDTPKGYFKGDLKNSVILLPKELLTGKKAYQWTALDFKDYWSIVKNDTPELKAFTKSTMRTSGIQKIVDTSWYKEDKNTYIIDSAADLYGLWLLSHDLDFKGKTIKLAADITVNTGNAADYATKAPEIPWFSISNNEYKMFAGTFDGQGHTISGLYYENHDPAKNYGGLFGIVNPESSIKNVRLINSYFERTGYPHAFLGSIVGETRGHIDSIYSDAILVSSGTQTGGIIGRTNSTDPTGKMQLTINNCWFDGEIRGVDRGCEIGGIIGVSNKTAGAPNGTKVHITNCLFSGKISCEREDIAEGEEAQFIGGILGRDNYAALSIYIKDCLSVGAIEVKNDVGVGSVLGSVHSPKCVATVINTYAAKESFVDNSGIAVTVDTPKGYFKGDLQNSVILMPMDSFVDQKAYQWTALDFDKYWSVAKNDTPELKSFSTSAISTSGIQKIVDTSWYQEDKATYLIDSAADLYGVWILAHDRTFKGKTIKLVKNIEVNAGDAETWSATNAPEIPWYPISNNEYKMFEGTFDGQGHTISGLYYENHDPAKNYGGLFGIVNQKSFIKNLRLTNSYFERTGYANAFLGSIVGETRGNIDSVYSDAIMVSSGTQTGGIVGRTNTVDPKGKQQLTINNCWFDGEIRGVNRGREIGGIIGVANKSTGAPNGSIVNITNCLFSGKISSERKDIAKGEEAQFIGGIIGRDNWAALTLNIADCLSVGKIQVKNDVGVGSVMGSIHHRQCVAKVSRTYASKECYVDKQGVSVAIDNPSGYYNGSLKGRIYLESEYWLSDTRVCQTTDLDFKHYWSVVAESTPTLMSFSTGAADMSRVIIPDISWMNEATGVVNLVENDPYVLSSREDLYGFAKIAKTNNFAGKTIVLSEDIEVNAGDSGMWDSGAPDNSWYPIGSMTSKFAGTFDGQGHTISGIYYINEDLANSYGGLFAATDVTSEIKNLRLTNSYFKRVNANGYMGSIVGIMSGGVLDSVYSDAVVTSNGIQFGGLVGIAEYVPNHKWNTTLDKNVYINNCWFDGEVIATGTGSFDLGGIVGVAMQGSNGSIARTSNIEGIFNITNCLNSGKITNQGSQGSPDDSGAQFVGGIIGRDNWCKVTINIDNCLNTGKITVPSTNQKAVGSIIGAAQHSGMKLNITNTNASKESYSTALDQNSGQCDGTVNADVVLWSKADLTGYWGYANTQLYKEKNWCALDIYTNDTKTGTFVIKENGTPELKTFSEDWLDFGWFFNNRDKTEFIITTAEELYTLSILVNNNYWVAAKGEVPGTNVKGFDGKTIRLGADITLNQGKAADWANGQATVSTKSWTPIGINNDYIRFAGTFDGQGHAISGLYLSDTQTNSYPGGLFGVTDYTSKIMNFKLTNSYLKRDREGVAVELGSIIGEMRGGTLRSVYSDAIVTSNGYHFGGLVGKVFCVADWKDLDGLDVYIDNCWFDGEVLAYGKGCNTGGIVGTAGQSSKNTYPRTVNITNCLNMGKISCEATATDDDAGYQYIGGIIGRTHWALITLNIKSCLNTGKLDIPVEDAKAVGSIMGAAQRSGSVVDIQNTYATTEGYTTALDKNSGQCNGTVNGEVALVARSSILGDSAKTENGCPGLFTIVDDASQPVWVIDTTTNTTNRGTPILNKFATWWFEKQ